MHSRNHLLAHQMRPMDGSPLYGNAHCRMNVLGFCMYRHVWSLNQKSVLLIDERDELYQVTPNSPLDEALEESR